MAEGCGKLPSPERRRFLQIAGGSARECRAILDTLCRCRVISEAEWQKGKELLARIVALLTRMMGSFDHVREPAPVYGSEYVCEYGTEGGAEQAAQPTRRATPRGRAAALGRWRHLAEGLDCRS
jgi:hypothetical protein